MEVLLILLTVFSILLTEISNKIKPRVELQYQSDDQATNIETIITTSHALKTTKLNNKAEQFITISNDQK